MGESRHPVGLPTVVRNQSPMLLLKRTALVALLQFFLFCFEDLDKDGADVVLLHGCPQSCTPNPVEGLLDVYEDMVEVLLVLKIFLTQIALLEDLLCGAPTCFEACLFFSLSVLQR